MWCNVKFSSDIYNIDKLHLYYLCFMEKLLGLSISGFVWAMINDPSTIKIFNLFYQQSGYSIISYQNIQLCARQKQDVCLRGVSAIELKIDIFQKLLRFKKSELSNEGPNRNLFNFFSYFTFVASL